MSDKYEFIDAEYARSPHDPRGTAPTITRMCKWLGVSKSGFYEWRSRPDSGTAKRQAGLKLLIAKAFDDSDGTYGYRRIIRQLARWGVRAGLLLHVPISANTRQRHRRGMSACFHILAVMNNQPVA